MDLKTYPTELAQCVSVEPKKLSFTLKFHESKAFPLSLINISNFFGGF